MVSSDFSNMVDNIQTTLVTILKADTVIDDYTKNILDGTPTNLTKNVGYPYILVHTPTFEDTKLTQGYSPKYKTQVIVPIEVIDKREGNVRKLCDAVRNSLKTNQATTRGVKVFNLQCGRTRMSTGEIPTETGSVTIYTINFPVRLDFYGS